MEPGPDLAARLQDSHPAATVLVARAEDMELPDASFDAVVAATSIHWMNLDVVLPQPIESSARLAGDDPAVADAQWPTAWK